MVVHADVDCGAVVVCELVDCGAVVIKCRYLVGLW